MSANTVAAEVTPQAVAAALSAAGFTLPVTGTDGITGGYQIPNLWGGGIGGVVVHWWDDPAAPGYARQRDEMLAAYARALTVAGYQATIESAAAPAGNTATWLLVHPEGAAIPAAVEQLPVALKPLGSPFVPCPQIPEQAWYQGEAARAAAAYEQVAGPGRIKFEAAVADARQRRAADKNARIDAEALTAWVAAQEKAAEAYRAIQGPAAAIVDAALAKARATTPAAPCQLTEPVQPPQVRPKLRLHQAA